MTSARSTRIRTATPLDKALRSALVTEDKLTVGKAQLILFSAPSIRRIKLLTTSLDAEPA